MTRPLKGISLYDEDDVDAFQFAKDVLERMLDETVTDGEAVRVFADSFVVSRGQFRPSLLEEAREAAGTESQEVGPTPSTDPNADAPPVMEGRLSDKPETISVAELQRGVRRGD